MTRALNDLQDSCPPPVKSRFQGSKRPRWPTFSTATLDECPRLRHGARSAGGEEFERVEHVVREAPHVVVSDDHLHVVAGAAGRSRAEDRGVVQLS